MQAMLEILSKEVLTVLIAAMPIVELRGAIPWAVALGVSPLNAFFLGLIGSMIPVPLLLLLIKPILEKLGKIPRFKKWVDWITHRSLNKTKKVQKYKSLGLLLFVAVPLPTTGVWTGSIAAVLLNIPFTKALLSIFIGNVIAGLILMTGSHLAVSL